MGGGRGKEVKEIALKISNCKKSLRNLIGEVITHVLYGFFAFLNGCGSLQNGQVIRSIVTSGNPLVDIKLAKYRSSSLGDLQISSIE